MGDANSHKGGLIVECPKCDHVTWGGVGYGSPGTSNPGGKKIAK